MVIVVGIVVIEILYAIKISNTTEILYWCSQMAFLSFVSSSFLFFFFIVHYCHCHTDLNHFYFHFQFTTAHNALINACKLWKIDERDKQKVRKPLHFYRNGGRRNTHNGIVWTITWYEVFYNVRCWLKDNSIHNKIK